MQQPNDNPSVLTSFISLQRRRDCYMLIYVFKIIHGYQPNAGFQWTFNARTGFHLSPFGHSDTCPHWVRKIRSNTIFDRGWRTFNLLPVNLRQGNVRNLPERKHLSSFKSALSTFLKTVPDLPDINDNSLLFHLQMNTHKVLHFSIVLFYVSFHYHLNIVSSKYFSLITKFTIHKTEVVSSTTEGCTCLQEPNRSL